MFKSTQDGVGCILSDLKKICTSKKINLKFIVIGEREREKKDKVFANIKIEIKKMKKCVTSFLYEEGWIY